MTAKQQARCLEAADKEAAWDWSKWQAQFDADMAKFNATLERWNAVERELSELHINTARDLRRLLR